MRYLNLGHINDDVYPKQEITSIRPSTRGLVFNDKGEIAILHIVGEDNFGKRDHYELPGGGLEENESYSNCFKREMEEELGVIINNPKILGIIGYDFNLINLRNVSMIFVAHIAYKVESHLTELEKGLFQEIKYVSIEEAIKIFSNPNVQNVGKLIHKREFTILKAYIKTLQK